MNADCISVEEYLSLQKKRSKWGNRRPTVDGHTFDSVKEANRYLVLKDMEQCGEIDDLLLQPEFVLLDAFDAQGKHFRAVKYRADFSYLEGCDPAHYVVEDVKGKETDVFIIKEKLFRNRYPDIDFRIVK